MRGRKPKPTAVHISAGDPSKLGKRKLQERLAREPKAAGGLPSCPRHLRGRARAAWNFWKQELEKMGIDARPDAMVLEGACVHYARAVLADIAVDQAGGGLLEEPIVSRAGVVVGKRLRIHPACSLSDREWKLTCSFCSEFGLTPVSRTRLSIEKQEDPEEDIDTQCRAPRVPRVPKVQ